MRSVPLNDPSIFELISGLWKGARGPVKPARVLRSTNFAGDGMLDFDDVVKLEVEERLFAARQLQPEDIIIERSGGGPKQPVGRASLFLPPDDDAYFSSNFTTTIRIRDRSLFAPGYVALYLHALYLDGATETLQRATTGIRNLDWREYLRIEVPVRPLQEQQFLARLIGGVRTAYRNEQQLIQALIALKRSTMSSLFSTGLRGEAQKDTEIGLVPESWNVVSFASIRERLQYGTSKPCTVESKTYPVLRIPNVGMGRVNASNLKYCEMTAEEADRYRLHSGDLLFIRTNGVLERLGSCAAYGGEPKNALFASYLIRARLRQGVDPRYVAYFYGSELGTSMVAGRATPAADGKYNMNTGAIDSLPLPLPPTVDEQREVVTILDAIDRKIDLHRSKRQVLEDLFKALLHKLMAGEISISDLDLSALSSASTQHEQAIV